MADILVRSGYLVFLEAQTTRTDLCTVDMTLVLDEMGLLDVDSRLCSLVSVHLAAFVESQLRQNDYIVDGDVDEVEFWIDLGLLGHVSSYANTVPGNCQSTSTWLSGCTVQ